MSDYQSLDRKLKFEGIDISALKEKKITYSYYGKEPGAGVLSKPKMELIKFISPNSSTRTIPISKLNGSFNPNYYNGGQNFCGEIDLYKALGEVSALDSYSIKDFVKATLNSEVPVNMDVITVDGQSYIFNDGNHRMLFLKAMYEQELREGKSIEELDKKYQINASGIELPNSPEEQICFGVLGKLNSLPTNTQCFDMIVEDGICKGYILTERDTKEKITLTKKEDIIRYTQKKVIQNYSKGNSSQIDNYLGFLSEEPEFKDIIEEIFPQINLFKELEKSERNIPTSSLRHPGLNFLDKEESDKIIEKYNNKTVEFKKITDIVAGLKEQLATENISKEQINEVKDIISDGLHTDLEELKDAKKTFEKMFFNDVMTATSSKINKIIANDKKSDLNQQINQLKNEKIGFLDRLSGKAKLRDLQVQNLILQRNNIQPENKKFSNIREISTTLKEYMIQNGMNSELSDFISQHSKDLQYPTSFGKVVDNFKNAEMYKREKNASILTQKMSLREIRSSLKTLKTENQELLNNSNSQKINPSSFQDTITISQEELDANQKISKFKNKATKILEIFQNKNEKVLESEREERGE